VGVGGGKGRRQYIKYIADIPTQEGRNAELALFQRRQDDAEQILLQVFGGRGECERVPRLVVAKNIGGWLTVLSSSSRRFFPLSQGEANPPFNLNLSALPVRIAHAQIKATPGPPNRAPNKRPLDDREATRHAS